MAVVPSGKPGNMAEKHSRILNQLKEKVSDCVPEEHLRDDFYMTRWLRARDYDLKKTESMLRNHMKWRKTFGADSVVENYTMPPVIAQYHTGGLCAADKEKQPIWWDAYGRCDIKGILHCVKKQDLLRWKVYLLERLYAVEFPRLSDETGVRVDSFTVVYDLKHYSSKHMWKRAVDSFLQMIQVFEDQYPETLKKAFVLNAPKVFPMLWRLAKPFLSDVTRKKIIICTDNGLEVLQKDIDIEQIPVEFGGTRVVEKNPDDPLKSLNMGGPVPKAEYSKKTANDNDDFVSATVSAGKKLKVEKELKNAGDKIKYVFLTEEGDLNFGIFRKTGDSPKAKEEVLASSRRDCYLVPDEGEFVCDRPGTYVCVFGNKHNVFKAKQLLYQIDVIAQDASPDSDED